jgi:hypothetical protein
VAQTQGADELRWTIKELEERRQHSVSSGEFKQLDDKARQAQTEPDGIIGPSTDSGPPA